MACSPIPRWFSPNCSVMVLNKGILLSGLVLSLSAAECSAWSFVESAQVRGARTVFAWSDGFSRGEQMMAGGAAAGDIDGDRDIDLVVLRGGQYRAGSSSEFLPPRVFGNDGTGHFTDITVVSGLSAAHLPIGASHNGAWLIDLDGDQDLDLVLGAIGAPPELWRNQGQGAFVRAQPNPFAGVIRDTWGLSAAPLDHDDRLDLVMSHWTMDLVGLGTPTPGHFWRQTADAAFEDLGVLPCCTGLSSGSDHTFTATLADVDSVPGIDLLWAADFGSSRMLRGNNEAQFVSMAPSGLPSDENGMGTALGDFDNDGDLDWFVTSIFDPTEPSPEDPDGNWGRTGNRLYRNDGMTWTEVSAASGIRDGRWGWGACARDFDLDGDLDLMHVNGFFGAMATEFHQDPTRLFLNDGNMVFTEAAVVHGLIDSGQGRAIVCTDFDADGDVDVLVQNSGETTNQSAAASRLFINDAAGHGLGVSVRLSQSGHNTMAVGAMVRLRDSAGYWQLRTIEAGGSFLGGHPIEAHFGVPAPRRPVHWTVRWPDGHIEHFAAGTAPMVRLDRGTGSDLWRDDFE